MYHDPTADLFFDHLEEFRDFVFMAVRRDAPDDLVGSACSSPFRCDRSADGSPLPLPDGGWDAMIRRGV